MKNSNWLTMILLGKLLLLIGITIGELPAYSRSQTVKFPAGFRWCVSTAAHQIEGNNIHSDHYKWETEQVDRVITKELMPNPLADELLAGSNGPFFSKSIPCPTVLRSSIPESLRKNLWLFPNVSPDQVQACEFSGVATDHWNRLDEDISLIAQLGVTEYRFSVEWAKVEPKEGIFDQAALDHYALEVQKLRAAGIIPQVTLFHFTMPQWLRDQGGWETEKSVEHFQLFTDRVYHTLGSQVDIWYTFNEPLVHLTAGYVAGVLPPGIKNFGALFLPLINILRAHAKSYHLLHNLALAKGHKIQVGLAHHLRIFDPASINSWILDPLEVAAARAIDYVWNWMIIDAIETGHLYFDFGPLAKLGMILPAPLKPFFTKIEDLKGTQDFAGLNYYTRDLIKFDPFNGDPSKIILPILNPKAIVENRITDMRWEIYPEGLYRILKDLNQRIQTKGHRKISILISENGLADKSDNQRINFLATHFAQMERAISEGVPLVGYCHWTLTDNFEWNSGYFPKFGFYSVNADSLNRTIKPSALWYKTVIQKNALSFAIP